MKKVIFLKDFYPSIIATRKAISILTSEVSFIEGVDYVFDFQDITFISRSFADEFVKHLKSSHIHWSFNNINANIQAIFDAVKKSHEQNRSNFDYVAITKFESEKEFNQFLQIF